MSLRTVLRVALGAVVLLAPGATLSAQSPKLEGQADKTPAEDSQFTRYTLHDGVAWFLHAVDRASHEAVVVRIGSAPPASDFPGAEL